ncbi:serine hydrolase domain-containing protein [Kitasatospora sp. NPDC094015]|uniref:serine hydrolase domain-containing protein n=1 Tax=Kitasatospora sp. NPDC094015 TaxID=3155205 RepID=UPI0033208053
MSSLRATLQAHVDRGAVAGAVALVARGGRVEEAVVGSADLASGRPMARDSIFRLASVTKPVVAAAVLMLVEDGRIALDDPVGRWLPELAAPRVVRTPRSPVTDTVPAARPITVADLLASCAGYGFPSDPSLPAAELLLGTVQKYGRDPQLVLAPDAWTAALAEVPLLYQPGEAWLYNTCSDLQGVLIARVTGGGLPEFLAERVFEPLGMVDTGFAVPPGDLDRFTSYYRSGSAGVLELVDAPDGRWSSRPAFPSGAGGLVSTADDWHAFARMLLAEGAAPGGRRLLAPRTVRLMTGDRLTAPQRSAGGLFLDGQSWGYGGSVDIRRADPWNVPGRYGWVGGTGTSAHLVPSTGAVTILLTQLAAESPTAGAVFEDFWRYAAGA